MWFYCLRIVLGTEGALSRSFNVVTPSFALTHSLGWSQTQGRRTRTQGASSPATGGPGFCKAIWLGTKRMSAPFPGTWSSPRPLGS